MTRRVLCKTLASAVVLGMCVISLTAQQPTTAKPAAIVNSEIITEAEVRAITDVKQPVTAESAEEKKARLDAAVNMLIDDALMRQFLKKYVPAATPQEVDKDLNELVEDLKKKSPPQTLQQYLQAAGQTEEQLKADIAGAIQWRKYLDNQIPEDTAKAYYTANKLHFDKVEVKASHVLVAVKATDAPGVKQAALAKIEAIRQEITGGKLEFAEAAKKYSDCEASKAGGGDIGYFRYKFVVVEPIARTAFSLKVGDISTPVLTEFGYHILKITDRKEGTASTYEALKDVIREVYAQDHEWYQRIITEQRKSAKIENLIK
jgi:parvulin-like peptidyl-prolyl isomerase